MEELLTEARADVSCPCLTQAPQPPLTSRGLVFFEQARGDPPESEASG